MLNFCRDFKTPGSNLASGHLSLIRFPFVSQCQDCLKSYGRGDENSWKEIASWWILAPCSHFICTWRCCTVRISHNSTIIDRVTSFALIKRFVGPCKLICKEIGHSPRNMSFLTAEVKAPYHFPSSVRQLCFFRLVSEMYPGKINFRVDPKIVSLTSCSTTTDFQLRTASLLATIIRKRLSNSLHNNFWRYTPAKGVQW